MDKKVILHVAWVAGAKREAGYFAWEEFVFHALSTVVKGCCYLVGIRFEMLFNSCTLRIILLRPRALSFPPSPVSLRQKEASADEKEYCVQRV